MVENDINITKMLAFALKRRSAKLKLHRKIKVVLKINNRSVHLLNVSGKKNENNM